MKRFGPLCYEVSPYIFFIIGICGVSTANTGGMLFGVLSLVAALLMIKLRRPYRRNIHSVKAQVSRTTPRHAQTTGSRSKRHRTAHPGPSHSRPRV